MQRKEGEKMNKGYKEEGESKLKRRLSNRGEGSSNKGKGQPNKNGSKGQRKIEKEQRKEVWDSQPKRTSRQRRDEKQAQEVNSRA